jgi:molybdopterin-guanine dinucleotide biosynthesis protein A
MKAFGSACILAGGRGERMRGQDKLYLELGGERLAARIAASLRLRFDDLIEATARPEAFAALGLRCVADEPGYAGPLAGLLAGLRAAKSRWLYLIAVDMPAFSLAWIDGLAARVRLAESRGEGALACAAASGPFFEPFQAFYSRGLLGPASAADAPPPRSIQRLLEGRELLRVPEAEALACGAPALFRGINTPEELAEARLAFSP